MNANELADDLENWFGNAGFAEHVAMLRQQQAEIERIRNIAESHIRSEYEGTSLLDGLLNDLYGKAQEK